jgi:malonyl-CoA decarboxylase
MFYSINSPNVALSGLELASFLIKEAAGQLSFDFPSITTFSTLSPVPAFLHWLGGSSPSVDSGSEVSVAERKRLQGDLQRDPTLLSEDDQQLSLRLCANYLVKQKQKRGSFLPTPMVYMYITNAIF